MVSSSFMGESLLRIQKMSRTTFSKTEGQKKTVRSPKTYEPKRLQPYSSCWSRLFYSLTRMAMQTHTHTTHTHMHVAGTPLLSSPEIHSCSHTQSWRPTHPPCSQATSPADHQSGLVFTGVSFNQKCQCEPLV